MALISKVVLLLAVAAVAVLADERPYSYRPPQAQSYKGGSSEESYDEAKYDFEWKVDEDDNDFGHQEERDGDHTQGSYYVDLPDGRRQTVTYYVDGDSGFVADVKYSGEAQYPEPESDERSYQPPRPAQQQQRPSYQAPQPSYQAPRPSYQAPRPSKKASRLSAKALRPSKKASRPTHQQPRLSYRPPSSDEEESREYDD